MTSQAQPAPQMKGQSMTTPSTSGEPRTPAETLRAAADFVEFSGQRDGVIVTCTARGFSVHVTEPYGDAATRQEIVTRLAALIDGTVRREDHRDFAAANLRADGAIGGLRAAVLTHLDVRRTGPRTRDSRPFAQAPGGRIVAVPGKRLPVGWHWVTELDPEPDRAAPRKHSQAGTARSATEAPALAARDCLPLTSAALQTAARPGQSVARQPSEAGARLTVPRPGRGSS
jgi:hypothetical protein